MKDTPAEADFPASDLGSDEDSSSDCAVKSALSHTDDLSSCNGRDSTDPDSARHSVDEDYLLDPDTVEERFRVDRKKLEAMLLAGSKSGDDSHGVASEFFQRIMEETNTVITWPSKLKIGAKSKKDPHVKVRGPPGQVQRAKGQIMTALGPKNRVSLKMDVSFTDHSHVIGRNGVTINAVMQDTDCHIHFPDSNRSSAMEKSNQVSVAGGAYGSKRARKKLRKILPLAFAFEVAAHNIVPNLSLNGRVLDEVRRCYEVQVTVQMVQENNRERDSPITGIHVTVRGSESCAENVMRATVHLMQQIAGHLVPVITSLEVGPHNFSLIRGRNDTNIVEIHARTGARVLIPQVDIPPSRSASMLDNTNSSICLLPGRPRQSTIQIFGPIEGVHQAWQEVMGFLPLVLGFDLPEGHEVSPETIDTICRQLPEVSVSFKSKRSPGKTATVKAIENHVEQMYQARRLMLPASIIAEEDRVEFERKQEKAILKAAAAARQAEQQRWPGNRPLFSGPPPPLPPMLPPYHPGFMYPSLPLAPPPPLSSTFMGSDTWANGSCHSLNTFEGNPVPSSHVPMYDDSENGWLYGPAMYNRLILSLSRLKLEHSSANSSDVGATDTATSSSTSSVTGDTGSNRHSPVHTTASSDKNAGSPGVETDRSSDDETTIILKRHQDQQLRAIKAMHQSPNLEKIQVPKSTWSGCFFSASTPASHFRKLRDECGSAWEGLSSHSQKAQATSDASQSESATSSPMKDIPHTLSPTVVSPPNDAPQTPNLSHSCTLSSAFGTVPTVREMVECDDLESLLVRIEQGHYYKLFAHEHIDIEYFKTLKENDLEKLGVNNFHARLRMKRAIKALNHQHKLNLAPGAERKKSSS